MSAPVDPVLDLVDLPSGPRSGPRSGSGPSVAYSDGWDLSKTHRLLDLVRRYDEKDPRSLQRHIGPSEIGSPCDRRLALKALHAPERKGAIAWRTRVGTAVHAWLKEAVESEAEAGELLAELRLHLEGVDDDLIAGTADVLWLRGREVVDWKIPGPTTMKEAKKGRIKVGYQHQGQVYGLAVERTLGIAPERVTIIFLPAAGEFGDAVVASRPYDREAALAAVERYTTIRAKAKAYGLAETVRRGPRTADDFCASCPYMGVRVEVDDLSDGTLPYDAPGTITLCRGHQAESEAR